MRQEDNNFISEIQHETVYETVYKRLKNAILTNQLPTGVYFTENELAKNLNISRTPVREAVKSLVNEGLFVAVPRKGVKVREFSSSDLEQIFLLRKAIESAVVKPFLEAVTDKQIMTLEDLVEQQKRTIEENDNSHFIQLDQTFHRTIIQCTDYDLFEEFIERLHNLTTLIGHTAIRKEGRMKEVIEEHEDIITAIRNKDVDNCVLKMTYHLDKTKESLHFIEK